MKRTICILLIVMLVLSTVSCDTKTIVVANDSAMLAYEGDQPSTEFDMNFPQSWGDETIQSYLDSYEPLVVHKGDVISLEFEDAVLHADAFRVCYVDVYENEVKHMGNATLDQNAFSSDRILIDTDWWYEDPDFSGQYTTWAYWISVSLSHDANPTRIYYLRISFA